MLFYGIGLGFRTVAGYLGKLQDIDALRPPHRSATYFKRTMGSRYWIPLPFGDEGPPPYFVAADDKWVNTTDDFWFRTAYLTADRASVTITGHDASLTEPVSAKTLTADQGSVAITGQDALTLWHQKIKSEQGSVEVTAQANRMTRALSIVAAQGSVAITGQACQLQPEATFISDMFSGTSLESYWATSGPGSVSVTGGYLEITTSSTTNTTVLQDNIVGAFDIVADILCPFYPSEISSAQYQCAFLAMVDADNYVEGYQNFNPIENKNEIKLIDCVSGFPYGSNPAVDPMAVVSFRVKREASNYFYVYYKDGGGNWVECGVAEGVRLNSSAPVSIGIRARAPAEETFQIDYVVTFGTEIIKAAAGSVAISFQDASFTKIAAASRLTADQGSVSISGQVVLLQWIQTRKVDQASAAIAGQTARFQWIHSLKAEHGAVAINGQDVQLREGAAPFMAETGTVSITGQAGLTLWMQTLKAEQGSAAIAFQTINDQITRVMIAQQGAAAVSGQVSRLYWHQTVKAAQGSVQISAQANRMVEEKKLFAGQGAVSVTLQDAVLTYSGGAVFWTATSDDDWVNTLDDRWYGVPSTYRMQAEQQTVTISGQQANLIGESKIKGETGTVTVTTRDAMLYRKYTLTAQQSSVTITGYDIFTEIGLFTLDADTMLIEIPAAYAFSGDPDYQFIDDGGFTWTKNLFVRLLWHRSAKAVQATVSINGVETRLAEAKRITAQAGSVTTSRQAARLNWNQAIKAERGTVTIALQSAQLAGPARNLLVGDDMAVVVGTQPGNLYWHQQVRAEQGAVSVAAQPAWMGKVNSLIAEQLAISNAAQDAGLYWNQTLIAEQAAVSIEARDVLAYTVQTMMAEQGSVTITGYDIAAEREYFIIAENGSISLTTQPVSFYWHQYLKAEQGAVTISGQEANLEYGTILNCEASSVTATGPDARLQWHHVMRADGVTVTWAGYDIELYYDVFRCDQMAVSISGKPATFYWVHVTPAARRFTVSREVRRITVEAESRAIIIPDEQRLIAVGE